jgi:hypothetical protein
MLHLRVTPFTAGFTPRFKSAYFRVNSHFQPLSFRLVANGQPDVFVKRPSGHNWELVGKLPWLKAYNADNKVNGAIVTDNTLALAYRLFRASPSTQAETKLLATTIVQSLIHLQATQLKTEQERNHFATCKHLKARLKESPIQSYEETPFRNTLYFRQPSSFRKPLPESRPKMDWFAAFKKILLL